MLELTGSVGVRVDVADLLELEAAFQREGVVEAAPDEEAALGVDEAAGEVLYLLTVGQTRLDDLTGAEQLGGQAAGLCLAQTASGVGQTECEEVEGAELHHIGFGGRHGDLRAGVGVEDVVRCAGDGAAHHIDDSQHRHAPALGEAEGGQRVAGLARLADDDDEVVGVEDGVTIAELAGDVHLGRDPGQPLDGSLAHHTGVHGRAAGHKVDVPDAAQLLIAQLRDAEVGHTVLHAGADGGRDGGRLLMDLFQHEVGVAALLSGFFVPVGGQHFPLHRLAEGVVEPDAVGLDHRHVALLEDAVAAGVLEQGRNIGGHEVLALAPAHDEGALLLDGVDGVRLIPEQHAQRIAAPHQRQRLPQGCQRALLGLGAAEVVDELDQHLGVRLALKGDALGHQVGLQRAVVLDDAVVDDAHAGGGVGMAVDVAGFAVGGPAGVSDAAEALGQVFCLQLAAEHFQPALALDDVDAAFQRQRDAGGVIAAVFQLFQTVQQHFLGAALTRITYDATHTKHLHADSPARTHTAAVSLLQSVYVLVWLSLKGFCCGIAAVFCPSLRLV